MKLKYPKSPLHGNILHFFYQGLIWLHRLNLRTRRRNSFFLFRRHFSSTEAPEKVANREMSSLFLRFFRRQIFHSNLFQKLFYLPFHLVYVISIWRLRTPRILYNIRGLQDINGGIIRKSRIYSRWAYKCLW